MAQKTNKNLTLSLVKYASIPKHGDRNSPGKINSYEKKTGFHDSKQGVPNDSFSAIYSTNLELNTFKSGFQEFKKKMAHATEPPKKSIFENGAINGKFENDRKKKYFKSEQPKVADMMTRSMVEQVKSQDKISTFRLEKQVLVD